jgi:hypothetical protein
MTDQENIRDLLFRLKTECEIAGLAEKPGFDCWIAHANKALAKPAASEALPPLPERLRRLEGGDEAVFACACAEWVRSLMPKAPRAH